MVVVLPEPAPLVALLSIGPPFKASVLMFLKVISLSSAFNDPFKAVKASTPNTNGFAPATILTAISVNVFDLSFGPKRKVLNFTVALGFSLPAIISAIVVPTKCSGLITPFAIRAFSSVKLILISLPGVTNEGPELSIPFAAVATKKFASFLVILTMIGFEFTLLASGPPTTFTLGSKLTSNVLIVVLLFS